MPKSTGLGRGLASLIPDSKSQPEKTGNKIDEKAKQFWSGNISSNNNISADINSTSDASNGKKDGVML